MAAAWLTRWSTRRMSPGVLVVASVGTAGAAARARGAGHAAARRRAGRGRLPGGRRGRLPEPRARRRGADGRRPRGQRVAAGRPGRLRRPALSLTSAVRQDDARRARAVGAVAQAVSRSGRLVLLAADSPTALSLPAGLRCARR